MMDPDQPWCFFHGLGQICHHALDLEDDSESGSSIVLGYSGILVMAWTFQLERQDKSVIQVCDQRQSDLLHPADYKRCNVPKCPKLPQE